MSSEGALKSAREAMEKSRLDVTECEEEIRSIKNALKSIAMGAGSAASNNSLEVSIMKAKAAEGGGDDDNAPTTFKIHLSSPIEERTLTRLHDPLDPGAEGGVAKFESIETSNALLTVETYSKDGASKMGASAPHDLMPLCQDMELWRKGGEKKMSTLNVAIVPEVGMDDVVASADEAPETEEAAEAVEADAPETAEGDGEAGAESPAKDESEKESEPTASETRAMPKLQIPTYILTMQLQYTPSPEDRRDALYDKLNEVSKRKVAAIESLRKNAAMVNRAKAAEATAAGGPGKEGGGGGAVGKRPAVKPGFLNKTNAAEKEEATPPLWKRWYEKTMGPNAMLWVVGPIAKNYLIFAGVSMFVHWKGDLLSLPAPV